MILPVASNIDWNQLFQRKQNVTSKTNHKKNQSRKDFDYQVGQRILILNKNLHKGKLEPTILEEGPWEIKQVHSNGTMTILRNNYTERINIGRVRPFFE